MQTTTLKRYSMLTEKQMLEGNFDLIILLILAIATIIFFLLNSWNRKLFS